MCWQRKRQLLDAWLWLCSMLRRTLNVWKLSVMIVEVLSNASQSRSEGRLQGTYYYNERFAIDLQTKMIRPAKQYLSHLSSESSELCSYGWLQLPRCLLEEWYSSSQISIKFLQCVEGCSSHKCWMCQPGMKHCWTCYSQTNNSSASGSLSCSDHNIVASGSCCGAGG